MPGIEAFVKGRRENGVGKIKVGRELILDAGHVHGPGSQLDALSRADQVRQATGPYAVGTQRSVGILHDVVFVPRRGVLVEILVIVVEAEDPAWPQRVE